MIIGITDHFDAAHYLPNYDGKCKEMHGHTWHVTVEVKGFVDEHAGMVMDLTYLKKRLKEIIETLDHKLLNNYLSNPTCEIIAEHIGKRFEDWIDWNTSLINVTKVIVKEGDGGYAIWET